jgi:hypothetical protein
VVFGMSKKLYGENQIGNSSYAGEQPRMSSQIGSVALFRSGFAGHAEQIICAGAHTRGSQ